MAENYTVGQVLFVIPADNPTVVPIQITERRIVETVRGTAIYHIVRTPKAQAKTLRLETIKGIVFTDLQQARSAMVRNATAAIDSMVKNALSLAQQAFGGRQEPAQPPADDDDPFDVSGVVLEAQATDLSRALPAPRTPRDEDDGVLTSDGIAEVDLGDGRKTRVKLRAAD